MPRLNIGVIPELDLSMTYSEKVSFCVALREEAAKALGLDVKHVEVLWSRVSVNLNAAPVSIDLIYSVRESFCPDEDARTRIVNDICEFLTETSLLPDEAAGEVSFWLLPQHEAVFKSVDRAPKQQ